MSPGRIVAVEGASAAGKTSAVEAAARATGWVALPEAYRRLSPPLTLEFGSAPELLALEERLFREDARRYSEARSRARDGATVIADTGFLGPLTYTQALIDLGAAPGSVLASLLRLARRLADRHEWGLADSYVYLDTPASVRSARSRADPTGPSPALARRHRDVGDSERGFYFDRFAPLLGARFRRVSGIGTGPVVARRLLEAARDAESPSAPDGLVDAVLALFEERDGTEGRGAAPRG